MHGSVIFFQSSLTDFSLDYAIIWLHVYIFYISSGSSHLLQITKNCFKDRLSPKKIDLKLTYQEKVVLSLVLRLITSVEAFATKKIEISVSLLSRVCGNQFSSFYKHLSLGNLKGAPEIVLLLFFCLFLDDNVLDLVNSYFVTVEWFCVQMKTR